MVNVYSHGDSILWKPTPTAVPKEWMKIIRMLWSQEPNPRYFIDFKNVRYDAQCVGDLLRSWGLPGHVVMAGYLWNCGQEQILQSGLQDVDLVIKHINAANQYMSDLEEKELLKLLRPPYADIGALLIVMATYYQVLQTLQKQSNNHPYTGETEANIAFIGSTLINLTTRLGMWAFKYPVEDLTEQLRVPKEFADASKEHNDILIRDSIKLEATRQLFLASYQDATQRNVTIVYKPCSVAGMKRRSQDAHTTATSQKNSLTGFDLVTYNIVVPTVRDCYEAFGVLSQLGYIQDRLTDLISNPKPNGCSHLAFGLILNPKGPRMRELSWLESHFPLCQIQIATQVMYALSWFGCLRPDYYRLCMQEAGEESLERIRAKHSWVGETGRVFSAIREGMALEKTMPSSADNVMIVYDHRRTPVVLPIGARVLDFAYALDAPTAEYVVEAVVNSRKAALYRVLNAGDIVELRTSNEVQMQEYWLYDDYTITPKAHQYIKASLTQRSKERRGYSLLRQELERHHYMLIPEKLNKELEFLVKQHRLGTFSDYLVQLDERREAPYSIAWATQEIMQQVTERNEITSVGRGGSSWTPVLAIPTTTTKKLYRKQRLCEFCQPTYPRDLNIKGIIREKNRELIVHRERCPQLIDDSVIISMTWEHRHPAYRVAFYIKAHDRKGLVLDITKLLHRHLCNFTSVDAEATSEYEEAWVRCTIETFTDTEVLDIWHELELIENVVTVSIDASTTSVKTYAYFQQLFHERQVTSEGASLDFLWEDMASASTLPRSKRLKNPFDISRPAEAEMFFGRTAETEMMKRELCENELGRALILYGPRRSGKSSLCRNFLESQVRPPFLSVLVSLYGVTMLQEHEIFKRIANEVSKRFQEQVGQQAPSWQDYDDDDPHIQFSNFLRDCTAQITGTRLILVLDEFGGALDAHQNGVLNYRFFTYWKELMDRQPQLSLIFALPTSSHTLLTKTFSHVFSFADSLPVTFLDTDSAERLLANPLSDLHIKIQPSTVARAVKLTGGHPFYMTLLGNKLINRLNYEPNKQLITDMDLGLIVEQLTEEGSFQHFTFLAGELQNRDEYDILQAIVELTSNHTREPKVRLEKIASWLGSPEYIIKQHLDRLRVGLILEENGPLSNPYYSFRIELVRRWLIRNRSFFLPATSGK